jgi:hypothetical protein
MDKTEVVPTTSKEGLHPMTTVNGTMLMLMTRLHFNDLMGDDWVTMLFFSFNH